MNVNCFFTPIFIAISLLIPSLSYCWNDTAHIFIAQIAKKNLKPGVMNKILNLAENIDGEFPPPFDFEEAACWANNISKCGMKGLDAWHEKLIPYDPTGVLTEEKRNILLASLEKNSISFALTEAVKTLKDPNSGPWEKNFMLRILLHCVGDIHHPLHCTSLYSPDFINGDNGGQFFQISGREEKSLRELWDNLAGNYVRSLKWNHDQTYEEMVEMELTLEKILSDFPKHIFEVRMGAIFDDWVYESHKIAIEFAYKDIYPGYEPTIEYVCLSRMIAQKQIALAGYRLANILNEVFMD